MSRFLLHTFLLAVITITVVESNETKQEAEKRGQQTLADVIKQLSLLKTGMDKKLNVLKAE